MNFKIANPSFHDDSNLYNLVAIGDKTTIGKESEK